MMAILNSDNVAFSYAADGERILAGVDLEVEAGETIGLAGTSGSGKSTLLKLPARFYDVDSGSVRIDGDVTQRVLLNFEGPVTVRLE